ncbi:putative nuclease HARBI1 isoform X3 [Eriocheir sinensis]|uniref:putative nuclease HARBI1 isoform X2 n=2 Tax=Eriocheir sinensis TaxID=95602 RepID=UPI0021CA13FD|nr:putative nuclease HARBI1 isoform X2 [Eriocheir sinensis]XP_050707772.1 putative nuclease HARBI1 isoform X3 [Eriocheir sinensis]
MPWARILHTVITSSDGHSGTKWRISDITPSETLMVDHKLLWTTIKLRGTLRSGSPCHNSAYDRQKRVNMAAPRQHAPQPFRRRDVLNELSDAELIRRYRFDKEGILYVTNLVREALSSDTKRRNPLTPEMKVIITLRYLATGKMQMCSSDDLGPSQPSISRAITQTIDALANVNILKQFISFPTTQDVTEANKADFLTIANFPGVIGVVDGTHVRIVAPKEEEDVFVNRKGYHSINVQVIFDANYRILDILAKWPGSVHDARILNGCGVAELFQRGHVPPGSHLLGDSGYPSKPWLLTPYLRPLPGPQSRYNRAHKRTRSVVERGIGQLKRRFHVLHSEVRVTPPVKVCKLIHVCGMLHNICKDRNIPIPLDAAQPNAEEVDLAMAQPEGVQVVPPLPAGQRNEGRLYRDEFCNLHFHNED